MADRHFYELNAKCFISPNIKIVDKRIADLSKHYVN